MAKLTRRKPKKAGLPPGTLIHVGEKKAEKAKITLLHYDETHFEERELKGVMECQPYKDKGGVTWINVDGIHEVEVIEKLGDYFGLHSLVLEDILHTGQRPKLEDFGDYLYIVVKMLDYNPKSQEVTEEQVSLILGSNFVLSFQEREGDLFNPFRERIRNGKGRSRRMGADYLAYALVDTLVDHYFTILEVLGEKIEMLENELVTDPTPKTLREIHALKREMIFLRRAVWPLRDVLSSLERGESPLIQPPTRVYLRDVYDHTIRVIDMIETLRDMLSGMLDIYLSSINNRLNEIMKVLTIIATMFIPLTFIASIYGMNFRHMPELEWPWGYPAVLLTMGVIVIGMLIYFRKKKWI